MLKIPPNIRSIQHMALKRDWKSNDVIEERVVDSSIIGGAGVVNRRSNLSGKIMRSGDDIGPRLLPLNKSGVGGFGAEHEKKSESGSGELVG